MRERIWGGGHSSLVPRLPAFEPLARIAHSQRLSFLPYTSVMETVNGPYNELVSAIFAQVSENLPRDLTWPILLLTIGLATGIWFLRGGLGAKGADGRMRRMQLGEFPAAKGNLLPHFRKSRCHPLYLREIAPPAVGNGSINKHSTSHRSSYHGSARCMVRK